jgi:hypothetical protein
MVQKSSIDTQAPWLVGYKCGVSSLNDAQTQSHTPCIVKQIVELPITCLSTNIGLEANYRSNIPQNVSTPHEHVS